MSQIRSDILYQHQKKKDQTDRQIKQLHISIPIVPDHFGDSDNGELQIIEEEDLLVSEDDEIAILNQNDFRKGIDDNLVNEGELVDSDSDENINQWNAIIVRWREEVNQENQFENNNDENLLSEDLDNDFLVGAHNIHPADNVNLKWKLTSIFINDLECPSCFTNDINLFDN